LTNGTRPRLGRGLAAGCLGWICYFCTQHFIFCVNFPPQFIEHLRQAPGFDEVAFRAAHQQPAPVSLRLNPAKATTLFSQAPAVAWCASGRYLAERPSFTTDPFFQAGAYYVQEASSMFLEKAYRQIFRHQAPARTLDLCAAPGGKSTLLASLLPEESVLVANEVIKLRANVLADNLSKWGQVNSFVSNNDPRDFQRLPHFFDLLVVDAPCSGSGLFRKDPEAMTEWSLEAVSLCAKRQQRILADAWDTLRPGGTLIYATCSYSTAENEDFLDWLGDNFEVDTIEIEDVPAGIVAFKSPRHQAWGYRFYPDKVTGEGFFLAAVRKTESQFFPEPKPFRYKEGKFFKNEKKQLSEFVESLEAYLWTQKGDDLFLLHRTHYSVFEFLQKNLYLRKAGIRLGQMAANGLIPDHELALSTVLRADVPSLELDLNQSLAYLRREALEVATPLRGWAVARYEGMALGWCKILPNRINNYFPKTQRILH
jgi:16S rRNA C967 or C1407 C5-methylase (RsmB/RsmF family)/NOL1/NOP2/fmu family ribosome biogenesis protein